MNQSGIHPLLDRVLVRPDEIEEKTEGGIIITEQVAERHQQAQAMGTFVGAGPDAFVYGRTHVYSGPNMDLKERRIETADMDGVPKPGDRVMFAKYGGLSVTGKDGDEYRVLNDRDITCLIDEGVKYTGIQARRPLHERR